MNIKTTLFLLALLIGIGIYFVAFEKGREVIPTPETQSTEKPVFIAEELFPDGMKTLDIHWADGQTATLNRDELGKWMQTAPVRFPLNTVRLQAGLVYDAATLRYTDKFTPDQPGKPTLIETGLDKPRVSIRFKGDFHDTQIDPATGLPTVTHKPFEQLVHLGGGITGSRAYIRINDDPQVYVVPNKLHVILLNERVASWRQRSLDVPSDAQASRIFIRAEDRTIEMMKPKGDWLFVPPLMDRVAPKAPMALLGALKAVPVGAFVTDEPENLAAYGLEQPAAIVSVHTTAVEPRVRTLRIGGPSDPAGNNYHATWSLGDEVSSVIFTITRDARARFMAITADDLRDPRITTASAGSIAQVQISAPDQPSLQIQKTPGLGWTFATESDQPAVTFKPDQEAVSQLIDAVCRASAKYYLPTAARPDKPLATIQFDTRISGEPPEQLAFFTPALDAVPKGDDTPFTMVLRNNETTGYLVPTASLQPVFAPIVRLRDRQVVNLKLESIHTITLKRADGVSYVFKQFTSTVAPSAKPQWQMVGAAEFERDMFEYLLKFLPTLRAETWIAQPKPFGPNTVEVTLESEGRPPVVLTCDLDTRQAKMQGTEGVYLVDEQTKILFDGEYRPRTILPLTQGDVTQITITRKDAKPITIGKDELHRFQALAPDGKPITTIEINATSAARLYDAMMPLRAWRYVDKSAFTIAEALTTFEIVTRTGKKHTLYVGFKDRPDLALCNDIWFTLAPDTLKWLSTQPMKKE